MRRIVFWVQLLAFAVPMVLDAQRVDLIPMGNGILAIRPVDVFGQIISSAEIVVYAVSDGKRLRVDWRADRELPFGSYQVEVSASGFARFSEAVSLNSRRLELFACLRVGTIDDGRKTSPPSKISMPGGDRGCKQVLIRPMFCPGNRIPHVAYLHEGSFVVEGLEAGRYIAVGVSPDDYCGAAAFDVTMAGAKTVGPPEQK